MLLPALNPDESKIKALIEEAENGVVNWIKDLETGDYYYWPADSLWISHFVMADSLKIKEYDKGSVTDDREHTDQKTSA